MRKVNIEAVVEINLPVKVKVDVLIRASERARLDSVLRQWAKGKWHTRFADVEDVSVLEVSIDEDAVAELIASDDLPKVLCHAEVTDSR